VNRHFSNAAASTRRVRRSRRALLLVSAVLAAPSLALAAPPPGPEIPVSGAGNLSLTIGGAVPPTTGSLNQAVAAISTGGSASVVVTGAGSLDATQSTGILMSAPLASTLTVQSGGSVSGATGIDASAHNDLESSPFNANGPGVTGGLALTNAGTVTGTGGVAIQFGSGDDTLTLQTGSVITGGVDGGAGNNVIVLNGTVATQTPAQTVGAYTNFQNLNVNTGDWTLAGTASYPTATIASGATLQVPGSLTGAVNVQTGGALVLGDGVSQGQLVGSLTDNGVVTFNEPADYTFDGAFSGAGSLIKDGAGVLTFAGLYSFTGVTTLNGGSIDIAQLAAGMNFNLDSGSLNLSGTQSNIGSLTGTGGTVTVAAGDTLTVMSGDFGGDITGAGALTKAGPNTLVLSGVDSLTGPTEVAGGVLEIDGSLTSPVTVDNGASLGGDGAIIGSITIASGGVFSPGDPVTTTVIGPVTFATGSSYFVQVTPAGDHDLIAVTGPVTIHPGSSVEVDPLGLVTSYGRQSAYPIITASGGVMGTFSGVTSDAPLLTPHLTYGADEVDLYLTRSDISFASLATTRNQAATAAAIEAGGFGSPLFMASVVQTAAGARQSYDALSGELFATLPSVLLEESDQIRRTLIDRLQTVGEGQGVWGQAFGDWGELKGGDGLAAAHTALGGFTLGLDGTAAGWRLGVAGTYAQDSITMASRASHANDQSEGVSVYGGTTSGPIAVRLGASYAWHHVDTGRSEVFPGFADNTRARFNDGDANLFGEVGYRLGGPGASLEPFAGVSYDDLTVAGAREQGGAAALEVGAQTREAVSTRLGLRASTDTTVGGDTLSLYGSLAWRHAFDDVNGAAQVAFEGTGQAFAINGAPIAQNAGEITAGVSSKVYGHGRVDLAYSGAVAQREQDHSIRLTAAWAF
jgi:fibronectin-binding autotransporter adhesin